MLRTELKIPVLAISLELYDDNTNTRNTTVKKTQWFDETSGVGSQVRGKRVLIMDEVDDTRTTLAFAVREVMKTNAPSHIAVGVVHNKLKPKEAELPPNITYMAGEDVPDKWNCYPWDAAAYGRDIYAHEALAAQWYVHLAHTLPALRRPFCYTLWFMTVYFMVDGRCLCPSLRRSAGESESAGPGSPKARLVQLETEAAALRARIAAQEAEADARAKSCIWWTAGAGLIGALVGSKVFA